MPKNKQKANNLGFIRFLNYLFFFFFAMAKFFFTLLAGMLCLLLSTMSLQAQTSYGNLMFGGSANIQASRGDKILVADFTPNVGVFIKDGLAIGGSVQYGVVRYGSNNNHTFLGLLPMVRYYFESNQPARLFVHGDAGYIRRTAEAYLRHGYGASAGPGIAYFLNQNVALESMVRFGMHQYSNGSSSAEFSFRFGAQLYLRPQR